MIAPIRFPHLRFHYQELRNAIDKLCEKKLKDDIKIYVSPINGLADTFGSLNIILQIVVHEKKLHASQITFHKKHSYINLHEYLTFKEILYVNPLTEINEEDYDILVFGGQFEGLYCIHPAHFRNYITLKDSIIEQAKKMSYDEGVHLRYKNQEMRCFGISDIVQVKIFQHYFEEIWNPQKKYFLSSDAPISNELVSKYSNVLTIQKPVYQWQRTSGRIDAHLACLDLACLSLCEIIYTTEFSGFPYLATLFGTKWHTLKQYCSSIEGKSDCVLNQILLQKSFELNYIKPLNTKY